MKRLFIFITFISLAQSLCAQSQLKIQPRTHLLSTYYDIYSDEKHISFVKRQHLQLNKIYSVRDHRGEYARGIAKLLSIGTFVKSLREIDVYDEFDRQMGSIRGSFTVSKKGKFTFFNRQNAPIALAYVDRDGSNITIVDSACESHPLVLFRRAFTQGKEDPFWEIRVYDEWAIEPSMLYIFAAFISDTSWPAEIKPEKIPSWESLQLLEIIKEIARDEP